MWIRWTLGLQSIAQTKRHSEAREAMKKKDAPCSTSMFKSEGVVGAKKMAIFLRMSFLRRACS